MNRIVERRIERSDDARTGVANFTVPDMSLIEYDCVVKSLTHKLSDVLGLNPSDKRKMNQLIDDACAFDNLLQPRGQIHLLVTMQEDAAAYARQMVAPVVSKLSLPALDRQRLTSAFATKAISDAFSIARRRLNVTISNDVCENSTCPVLNAPAWTRTNHPHRSNDFSPLLQIELNDDILQSIKKMSVEQLILVYGKSFIVSGRFARKKTDGKVALFMRN